MQKFEIIVLISILVDKQQATDKSITIEPKNTAD